MAEGLHVRGDPGGVVALAGLDAEKRAQKVRSGSLQSVEPDGVDGTASMVGGQLCV